MEKTLDPQILEKMMRFRNGELELTAFQNFITMNIAQLKPVVPPGVMLKLRRGDKQTVIKAVAIVFPNCSLCEALCDVGHFTSRQAQSSCEARVYDSFQRGDIQRVSRPEWFNPTQAHFGADGYFSCTRCGSIWNMVEPEREDNGLWGRIA